MSSTEGTPSDLPREGSRGGALLVAVSHCVKLQRKAETIMTER